MKLTQWMLVLSFSVFVLAAPAFARGGHGGRHGGRHFGWFGHHHEHHLVEGVILGSIIGSAIVGVTRDTIEVAPVPERDVYIVAPRATQNTFRLESNGDCFLVNQNSTGDQVLTKVPGSNCY